MEVFWTADTHFSHRGVIKHNSRPFSCVEEHDEILKSNWNSMVPKKDSLVIVIGDFAWKNHNRFISSLNGKKILIVGSHDRMPQDCLKNFTEVHRGSTFLNIHNQQFFASHCCHRVWEKSHYGVPHLYGHSHGRLLTYNMSGDVGVDSTQIDDNKYFPKPHEIVLKFIETRRQMLEEAGRIWTDEITGKKIYRQDDLSYFLKKFGMINDSYEESKYTKEINSEPGSQDSDWDEINNRE